MLTEQTKNDSIDAAFVIKAMMFYISWGLGVWVTALYIDETAVRLIGGLALGLVFFAACNTACKCIYQRSLSPLTIWYDLSVAAALVIATVASFFLFPIVGALTGFAAIAYVSYLFDKHSKPHWRVDTSVGLSQL